MTDVLEQVLAYVRGAWRHRWYMVITAWVICVTGWTVVALLPDQYTASARVYADTTSILRPLLRGLAIEGDVSRKVALMSQTLLSQPNLEKLTRMADLDITASTPAETEQLINDIRSRISIQRDKREDIYVITYVGEDPAVAKKVVQSLLTIFVEGAIGGGRENNDVAASFIDEQIKEYQVKLKDSEAKIAEFKRKNMGIMSSSGGGGDYYSNLQTAMSSMEDAKLVLQQATNRRDELKLQLNNLKSTLSNVDSSSPVVQNSELGMRLKSNRAKLDDLLQLYTENHPKVIALKSIISDLEKQIEVERKSLATGGSGSGGSRVIDNSAYQQIKIALAGAEADVSSARARVAQLSGKVGALQSQMNSVPGVETEFASLMRDYELYQSKYQELLSRRETASMSQQVEATGERVSFKVIDPPIASQKPSGPNRLLYTSIVGALGLAAGIVLAIFMALIRPTFDSTRKLIAVTQLPVLGEIRKVLNEAQLKRMRMEMVGFISASGLWLFALVALLIFEKIRN